MKRDLTDIVLPTSDAKLFIVVIPM